MSKIAVIPINYHSIQLPIDFKRAILLFDKIILEEQSLGLARQFAGNAIKKGAANGINFEFNNQNIDYLLSSGFVEFETINKVISVSIDTPEERYMESLKDRHSRITTLMIELKYQQNKSNTLIELMDELKRLPNSFARAISIRLNNDGLESFPIFDEEPNYTFGKKEKVLKFILSKIPSPSDDTSWEKIMDFKNDDNTKNKYNALINWVNKTSKGESYLNEIEDEYNYLYSDYLEQYRFHKMKHKLTSLEIIATLGFNFIAGNLGISSLKTSAFRLWQSEMNLLESESKFTGKEIAYIHKVNQKFT
jgi:uncharacterized protein YnzC (UPF0291/DUF896 family)